MKVSVCVITFQQEAFIEQAVRSALDQVTDFDFEVIVGDDASRDGTADILRQLQTEYPTRLRLLLAEQNYGDYGLSNLMGVLDAATGDYIALLDGDDFWTDPSKLQAQADFLDAHPDCTICAHRSKHLLADEDTLLSPRPINGDGILPIAKLVTNNFAEKAATMVRRDAVQKLPDWYRTTKAVSCDWVFNVLIGAQSGKIGYIDKVMSVHRFHQGSVSVHHGTDGLLADKLKSLDLVAPHLPDAAKSAVSRARWIVRLKRAALKISPNAYLGAKKLGGRRPSA